MVFIGGLLVIVKKQAFLKFEEQKMDYALGPQNQENIITVLMGLTVDYGAEMGVLRSNW